MFEKPEPRPRDGATDPEAIELCAAWMRYLGAPDTIIANGGDSTPCDLFSSQYLAWVENRSANVDSDLVARAISVCEYDGRKGVIFFRYGFDTYASEAATERGIILLSFTPEDGDLHGLNRLGREFARVPTA